MRFLVENSCPHFDIFYWSKNDSAYTVPEAQFRRLENPKLAFATATSNSDRSPQKVAQHDGIISWKIDYRTEIKNFKNLNFRPPDLKHVRYQGSVRTNDGAGSVYKVSMSSIMYTRMLRMSYCFMEAKISLGRPTWRWDLYFFTANTVCCASSPFLQENISFCGCSNDAKRCAPICVHVPPDFPEETTHGDRVAHHQQNLF